MKGISLILGNEIETKGCHPKKPAKMSAKNEGNKMAEGNAENGECKMAAEPRARYNLRSCAQRGKAAGEEGKLPHLGKPRDELIDHQKKDESLKKLYNLIGRSKGNKFSNIYYLEDGILTRWRSRKASMDGGQNVFRQLVMPKEYCKEMLRLAHEVPMAGHLGVAKTRNKLLEHFYWPGVEKDVKTFCGSCQICQSTGKPNQKTPRCPIEAYTNGRGALQQSPNRLCGSIAPDKGREQISLNVDVCHDEIPRGSPTEINNHQEGGRSHDKLLRESRITSNDTNR